MTVATSSGNHLGLLHPSADPGPARDVLGSWWRAAAGRGLKMVTLTGTPPTTPGVDALVPADLHPSAAPVGLVERALAEGHAGLGVLIRAEHVITSTSREFHEDVEATLSALCGSHPVSVLCVYDRPGVGVECLDMAVAHHGGGLHEPQLTVRRGEDVVELAGEVDVTNLDVVAAALEQFAVAPPGGLCVDLSGVTFLSAGAAQVLHRRATALRERGADVEFGGAPPHVGRFLRLVEDYASRSERNSGTSR